MTSSDKKISAKLDTVIHFLQNKSSGESEMRPQVPISVPSRIYAYLSSEHAIQDLALLRMKLTISTQTNDPLEYACDFREYHCDPDKDYSKEDLQWIRRFQNPQALPVGFIPCSRRNNNSLLWAYYGGHHTGMCLGLSTDFQFPGFPNPVQAVHYDKNILIPRRDRSESEELELIRQLFTTKQKWWIHEEEVRVLVPLNDSGVQVDGNLYFLTIDKTAIKSVAFGLNCSRGEIGAAILWCKYHEIEPELLKMEFAAHTSGYHLFARNLSETEKQECMTLALLSDKATAFKSKPL